MLLETLDRVNVGSLVIKDPSRQPWVLFDQLRDIPTHIENALITHLKNMPKVGEADWIWFSLDHPEMAAQLKILFPEKEEEFKDEELDWQVLHSHIKRFDDKPVGMEVTLREHNFLKAATALGILYPERITELDSQDLQFFQKRYSETKMGFGSENLLGLRLIFPQAFHTMDLESEWKHLKKEIEDNKEKGYWYAFALKAATARVIFPQKINDLNFDKRTWNQLRAELLRLRQRRHWEDLTGFASNIKILAAEEVRVSDKGMELVMPKPKKSFIQPTLGLPEVRRF